MDLVLKWGVVLFLGIGLASFVTADAFLVDPVVQKAKAGGTLDAGAISPGEKLEIIFSTDSGYGKEALWKQVKFGTPTPNTGISTQNSAIGSKSLITFIEAPAFAVEGEYEIPITMVGDETTLKSETFTLRLGVHKNLVRGSLGVREISGKVNAPSDFEVLLVNDSSAPVTMRVEPALPFTWSEPQTVTLNAHAFQPVTVRVIPRFAGPKTFDIKLIRMDTGITLDTLKGTVDAKPTLKDRYSAGLYGFPFFTISLVADYMTNALFSLFL